MRFIQSSIWHAFNKRLMKKDIMNNTVFKKFYTWLTVLDIYGKGEKTQGPHVHDGFILIFFYN